MKPRSSRSLITFLFFTAACIISIGLLSWDDHQRIRFQQNDRIETDTVPKKGKKIRDLDDAILELEEVNLDREMEQAMKEVEKALKELNDGKLQLEIEKSLKDIDVAKLEREIKESLSKVDFDEMERDLKKSLASIDFDKMEREIKESLEKVDLEEMKADIERLKNTELDDVKKELDKAKKEMDKIGPDMKKSLDQAKVEIEKMKVELKEYKSFVDGLASDGLINKKETYTIRHRDGKLLINGKEADAGTYNKYRSFLEKHKKFTIEKEHDDFNIDID